MRKIIDGKAYDTDKAEMVADWDNGLYSSNFKYVSEQLYRKNNGEYFIVGSGGAMTEYATQCDDNSWCGDSRVHPITENQAKRWVERHCDARTYDDEFGYVDDDGEDCYRVIREVVSKECYDLFMEKVSDGYKEDDYKSSGATLEEMIRKCCSK